MTVPESVDFEAWRVVAESGEFEPVLAALEESVTLLERGGLSLATMTECYELGLKLSRRCSDLLRAAELRISTLDQEYADGDGAELDNDEDEFDDDDVYDEEDPPF